MRFYRTFFSAILGLLFLNTELLAQTNTFRSSGHGAFTLSIPYMGEETIGFEGGAGAEINGDYGFGFGYMYQQTSKFAWGFDSSWNSSNYTGTRIDEIGDKDTFGGVFDSFSLSTSADYYFLDKPITPYIRGELGWSQLDSNIPAGPPLTTCWWDPWYGYLCDYIQPTYSDSSWHYGLGLGVRADINSAFFLKLSYSQRWLDLDRAKGNTGLDIWRLEIGFNLEQQMGYLF